MLLLLSDHFYLSILRYEFPLLTAALNYLDVGVTGKVKNLVKTKNNKFVFHLSLDKCEQLNSEEIDLALLNRNVISL